MVMKRKMKFIIRIHIISIMMNKKKLEDNTSNTKVENSLLTLRTEKVGVALQIQRRES
jgi:hypothetical protein